MALFDRFCADVEAYLAESGMPPTSFGLETMNDGQFVFQIRAGRNPTAKTMERVWQWIEDNPITELETGEIDERSQPG